MYFAFHRLYTHTGDVLPYACVRLDSDGVYMGHDRILSERPFVQWIGGCCILLPESLIPQKDDTVEGLLSRAKEIKTPQRLLLWHLCGVPADIDMSVPVSLWVQIK